MIVLTIDLTDKHGCVSTVNFAALLVALLDSHFLGCLVDKYMSALSGSNGLKDYGP